MDSQSTTPKEYTSEAFVAVRPAITSGASYWGVAVSAPRCCEAPFGIKTANLYG